MDIDSPPSPFTEQPHSHLSLPPLSASFPLPFRVLFLIGLAILLWATNLHILHLLGLDTAWILDVRDTDPQPPDLPLTASDLELDALQPPTVRNEPDTPTRSNDQHSPRPRSASVVADMNSSKTLYAPVYKLFVLYTAWVGGGWLVFRMVTGADTDAMERWRWLVAFIALGAGLGIGVPWRGIGEKERVMLRRAIQRIILPPAGSPIFFADVILADILTSFAKVLGDMWVSACQIWNGGITEGRVQQSGWARYVTLSMVCLPYLIRFRQCLLEYHQSHYSAPRPLANALKYFSAFPVIILSAAQKNVLNEIANSKGLTVAELAKEHDRWFGEHRLFRLWLLAVVVNSMYSFYWDVEMDWGLALCEVDTWLPGASATVTGTGMLGSPTTPRGRRQSLSIWARAKRLIMPVPSHQRSPCPTPGPTFTSPERDRVPSPLNPNSIQGKPKRFFHFGLRHTLLLPDPIVYHLFAFIDLVLRFTWSLKLSSHLHTISEIESGVFMMEALELMRRWMWVFIRVEWEAVKLGEARGWHRGGASPRPGAGGVIWAGEGQEDADEKALA